MRDGNIDTSDFSENETLFFIRIKGKEQFFKKVYGEEVIKQLFGHFNKFYTFSEYPNADHHINLNKVNLADFSFRDFEIYNDYVLKELHSIIFRCRGLRAIDFHEAKELTLLCAKYFIDLFRKKQFKLIVIHIIDNYILDIMYRIAKRMGIEVIVISEFFISGYRRHTIYGEYNFSQEPTLTELNYAEKYFEKKEKSFWLKGVNKLYNLRYFTYLYFSYYAKLIIRYYFGYKLFKNRSYEYRFAFVFNKLKLNYLNVNKYFDRISKDSMMENISKSVYLPLHVYPEANVDYWIGNPNNADYYFSILEAIAFFRERNMDVYIKEHPGFLYQRDPSLYAKMKSFGNVKIIHPFDPLVNMIDEIPNILVWHGSAGVEGLMQDKKVVVYDTNYYSEGFVSKMTDFDSLKAMDGCTKRNFLKFILSGVIKFEP